MKVKLGKNGVEEVLGLGPLFDYEKEGLEALKPELKSSIEKGLKFTNFAILSPMYLSFEHPSRAKVIQIK